MKSKTWFLAAACVVIALALGFWWSMGEKDEPRQKAVVVEEPRQKSVVVQKEKIVPKTKTGECTRHKKMTQEDAPPLPAAGSEEPEQLQEPEPEPELVTIQGVIECMDPCTQTILVDETTIDVSPGGNFPMYSTYQIGDFVEVSYREEKTGNLLNSIEILQKK